MANGIISAANNFADCEMERANRALALPRPDSAFTDHRLQRHPRTHILLDITQEAEEEATVFNLTIEDGELNIESGLIRAEQGDDIILRVDADEKGVLHLHGYDIFIP